MSTKPKECPFCGQLHGLKVVNDMRVRKMQILCSSCGAEGPLTDKGPNAAWHYWNDRAEDRVQPERSQLGDNDARKRQ